jgi:hypothetical protein
MHSHLLMMALFAFFVSLVFAVIAKETARDQMKLGSLMFAGFMLAGIVVSWLMFPFPIR